MLFIYTQIRSSDWYYTDLIKDRQIYYSIQKYDEMNSGSLTISLDMFFFNCGAIKIHKISILYFIVNF